jgi:hypothetical protein
MLTRAKAMLHLSFRSRASLGYATRHIVHPQNCNLQTCVPIGLDTIDATGRGNFIVATNYQAPFCGK